MNHYKNKGFTLVELAIVIVIIGLLVGGVLQGQELIRQATVNSTISQINKYNTSQATFRAKYNFFPGDMRDPEATNFGFLPRGAYAGQGDGNGIIQGVWGNGAGNNGLYQQQGETCMFWVDLTTAKLLDGSFATCRSNSTAVTYNLDNIDLLFPKSKYPNNHVFIWGWTGAGSSNMSMAGNWFSISAGLPGASSSATGISVLDAYSIDKKMDDGLPQLGNVNTLYMQTNVANPWWSGLNYNNVTNVATPVSATSCSDNNNIAGRQLEYSLQANSDAKNCALSLKFQ